MRVFRAKLKSTTPYSQSKYHQAERLDKELHDDYERRTWREKMHVNGKGTMVIPPSHFKNCITDSAKYLSIQIPGKGKATYTKHFEAGILVVDGIDTGIKKEDVQPMILHVPSDGRPGGGKRVPKWFPTIPAWEGSVDFHVLDNMITRDVFEQVLIEAGNLIGTGSFRPRNRGWHGRFQVLSVKEISS